VREGCDSHLAKFEHLRSSVVNRDVLALVSDDEAVAVVTAAFEAKPEKSAEGIDLTRENVKMQLLIADAAGGGRPLAVELEQSAAHPAGVALDGVWRWRR